MEKLTNLLLALRLVLHNAHLSFNCYSIHLLTDRIIEEIDENIDRLKEVSIGETDNTDIADAKRTAEGIFKIISAIKFNPQESLECLTAALTLIENVSDACDKIAKEKHSQGYINAVCDVAEWAVKGRYLIKNTLKGTK